MDPFVAPDHPVRDLVFFVAGQVSDDDRQHVEDLINRVREMREWVLGPPEYVDEPDGTSPSADEAPVVTVGGLLRVFSSLPPWKLPREIDLKHFMEVSVLFDHLKELSLQEGITFEVELDGDPIGTIEGGALVVRHA